MKQLIVLPLALALALTGVPLRAHSSANLQAAVPAAPVITPPATCGGCRPPPCRANEQFLNATPGRPIFRRTHQGILVRLQPIDARYPVTALSLYDNTVAWAEPPYSLAGERFSHRPRLYLATLDPFRVRLVSLDLCRTYFEDVRLSARWMVWTQNTEPWVRAGSTRIWALDLRSGRRLIVDYRVRPDEHITDSGPLALDGDIVAWARGTGSVRAGYLASSILSRRLPGFAFPFYVSNTVHAQGGYIAHLISNADPQLGGGILVWVRTRSDGSSSSNAIMEKSLTTGHIRQVAPNGLFPVTNGRTVAWLLPTTGQVSTLVRLDLRTGRRLVLSRSVDTFTYPPSAPRISSDVLAWRAYTPGNNGLGRTHIIARDLRTGREYDLADGEAVQNEPNSTVLVGPGWGSGNRVIWQEIHYDRQGHTHSYLATADVP